MAGVKRGGKWKGRGELKRGLCKIYCERQNVLALLFGSSKERGCQIDQKKVGFYFQ